MSLRKRPEFNTAALIATGPYSLEGIGEDEVAEGLTELEGLGLAHQAAGGWRC